MSSNNDYKNFWIGITVPLIISMLYDSIITYNYYNIYIYILCTLFSFLFFCCYYRKTREYIDRVIPMYVFNILQKLYETFRVACNNIFEVLLHMIDGKFGQGIFSGVIILILKELYKNHPLYFLIIIIVSSCLFLDYMKCNSIKNHKKRLKEKANDFINYLNYENDNTE